MSEENFILEEALDFKDPKILLDKFTLMLCDAKCYLEMTKFLINSINKWDEKPTYGDTTAYHTLAVMWSLDLTVFIDAVLTLLSKINKTKISIDDIEDWADFEKRLKSVRKGIHLYNKFGPYEKKATQILKEMRKEFGTDRKDWLYSLRSDEAFAYFIDGRNRFLCGAQGIYNRHILDYERFTWKNEDIKLYSYNITAIVNAICRIRDDLLPKIDTSIFKFSPIRIESFDDKISNVFSKLPVSEPTAVRISLILTRISYASLIYRSYVIDSQIEASNEWLVFFTRWFALQLDEVLDSINNLREYCNQADSLYIDRLIDRLECLPDDIAIEKIKKARNLIHYDVYEQIEYSANQDVIEYHKPFFVLTDLYSIDEVKTLYHQIIQSILELQSVFCSAFGDKGKIAIRNTSL